MAEQVRAEIVGTVISVDARVGDELAVGDVVATLESMKMEIPVITEFAGRVRELAVSCGDTVRAGDRVASLAPTQPVGP